MGDLIQYKLGRTADWLAASAAILQVGEPGYDIETLELKIGDGVHTWVDLPAQTLSDTLLAQLIQSGGAVSKAIDQAADTRSGVDFFARSRRGGGTPSAIAPLATLDLLNTALSPWFAANYSTGDFFTVSVPTPVIGFTLPIGANPVGNIEVCIFTSTTEPAAIPQNAMRTYRKVATSGVLDAATLTILGQGQTMIPLLDNVTLPPGEYAVAVWCSTTSISLVHKLSNTLKGLQVGAASISSAGGLPETFQNEVGGGRTVAVAIRVAPPTSLGLMSCLGDSITQGGADWIAAANAMAGAQFTAVNRGVGGETTADMRARIGSVVSDAPAVAFIFGGANDLGRGIDPQVTIANLAAMFETVLENTTARVVAATVLPRGAVGSDSPVPVMNASRAQINGWLRSIKHPRITVVDWSGALSVNGDDSTYNPSMFTDHVHPNARGKRVMSTYAAAGLTRV